MYPGKRHHSLEYGKRRAEPLEEVEEDDDEEDDEEEEEEEGLEGSEEDVSMLAQQQYYAAMKREWQLTPAYHDGANTHMACRYEDLLPVSYPKGVVVHPVAYPKEAPPLVYADWTTRAGAPQGVSIDMALLRPLQGTPSIDPMEVYCSVPGRTSLLSSTTKYSVSIAEIQRRINPPECLNASLLGAILRKAKSKDGGKALRDSLRKIGIVLPAGRRKQTSLTCWTALVEEEASHMARDFALVCDKEFHAREIALHLIKGHIIPGGGGGGGRGDYGDAARRMALHATRQILDELIGMLSADRTPIAGASFPSPLIPFSSPFSPSSSHLHRAPLDPHLQQHLSHFSLVTHGFGCVAMGASLSAARAVVDEAVAMMERPPQQGQGASSYVFGSSQDKRLL